MGQRRKAGSAREGAPEQAMRDQEVIRANRELAAYFKGRRTEREARAALKIIKAFVRNREHQDARSRPPLPGVSAANTPKEAANQTVRSRAGERRRRKARRTAPATLSRSLTAPIEPQAIVEAEQTPHSVEPASE